MDSSALDIAIVALEKEISGLELSIDALEKWLWISSAAVAVGVILEIAFLVREYLAERDSWLRGILIPPSRPSFRVLLFEIASVVVVVAGIVGELSVGVVSANRNADLRSKNTRLVSLIREKAGDAQITAGNADKDAGDAKERAGKLESQAATLRKQAEDERIARINIEDAVAWRRLSKPQISEFGSSLAIFTRQLTALAYNTGDLEAYSFAADIDVALHEFAHWNIAEPQAILKMREGPVNFGTNPPLDRGVTVSSTSDAASRRAANAIVEKLLALGFDTTLGNEFVNARPTVHIFIEPRPEGPQGAAKLRAQSTGKRP